MSAYIIANVRVNDTEVYDEYRTQVPATLEPHGGRFLVRGGEPRALEGDWHPRVVVIEFPDRAAALAWYESPEYQRILPLRQRSAESRVVLADGLGG